MLVYLDNYLSADPEAATRMAAEKTRARGAFGFGRPRMARPARSPEQGQGRRRGLNENYAREIMELHTLGVDGGYTQKDVTEVARCFTGWTIRDLRRDDPRFVFDERLHDRGDKTVLGQRIKGGGQDEGERVIHLLATQPATAHFISYKLARRFVADEPPPALVDRAAATFQRTSGDIRAVVETIVTSPEFRDPAGGARGRAPGWRPWAHGARVRVGVERARAWRIATWGCVPAAAADRLQGHADAWVSTSGLLAR
jgi:hypothetical protein